MKNSIKVSVIIPVYNQEYLIERCLNSIPKRKDIEIIVVNDGSFDETLQVLELYKENTYKDLIIITYKENKGVSYARNQGLDIAQGKYVLMVDSDDYIFGDVFNTIVRRHLKNADMIFYDMEDNGKKVYRCREQTYQNRWGMFKFIRRSFIGDTRFVVGKQYAEDRVFTMELFEKNPKIKLTNLIMYHYNYPRSGSLSAIGEHR